MKVEVLPGNSMTMTVTEKGLILEVEDKPKSDHKAGEPFNDQWAYAGELKEPELGEQYISRDGITPLRCTAIHEVNMNINSGLREILRPRKKEPTYEVGQIVELKGVDGAPSGKYKVMYYGTNKPNEFVIDMNGNAYFSYTELTATGQHFVVAPMPSTGYYDFDVCGVKCRAYESKDSNCVHILSRNTGPGFSWYRGGIMTDILDIILDSLDARLKSERGEGIRVVPYAVSDGKYEAPKADKTK